MNNPTSTSNCTWYQKVLIARSRNCFSISNRGSWLPWSNNAHGMQHIRRELGRKPQGFSHHMDETEYKPPWRIFREFRSPSVWDVCRRNTGMAKTTWPIRCWIHWKPSIILGYMTQRQCQWVVHKEHRMSQKANQRLVARIGNKRITEAILKFIDG